MRFPKVRGCELYSLGFLVYSPLPPTHWGFQGDFANPRAHSIRRTTLFDTKEQAAMLCDLVINPCPYEATLGHLRIIAPSGTAVRQLWGSRICRAGPRQLPTGLSPRRTDTPIRSLPPQPGRCPASCQRRPAWHRAAAQPGVLPHAALPAPDSARLPEKIQTQRALLKHSHSKLHAVMSNSVMKKKLQQCCSLVLSIVERQLNGPAALH